MHSYFHRDHKGVAKRVPALQWQTIIVTLVCVVTPVFDAV